jgi:hypothetical protein
MSIFYLEPKDGNTLDPSWAVSSIKEGCWIDAETEELARCRVQGATLIAQDIVPRSTCEGHLSPWGNIELTDCKPSHSRQDIPAGKVLTESGKILDAK